MWVGGSVGRGWPGPQTTPGVLNGLGRSLDGCAGSGDEWSKKAVCGTDVLIGWSPTPQPPVCLDTPSAPAQTNPARLNSAQTPGSRLGTRYGIGHPIQTQRMGEWGIQVWSRPTATHSQRQQSASGLAMYRDAPPCHE